MNAPGQSQTFGGAVHKAIYTCGTLSLILIAVYFIASAFFEQGYTPLGNFGAPVVAKYDDGDRAFLLTGQWRTLTFTGRGSTGRSTTNFYVDLWSFDAATAKPLWRKRLESERGGGYHDRTLMGVHGKTVWLLIRQQIVAISAENGAVLLTAGKLEGLNPELRGLMPTEDRYFTFDGRGLLITTADARQWRIDPSTFKVQPVASDTPPDPRAFPPVYYTPNGTSLHMVRSVASPERWLGMMTDDEAKFFEKNNDVGESYEDERRRMWSARIEKQAGFLGEWPDYVDVLPVPGTADYLGGKFLREYDTADQLPAIQIGEPDSVLLLSRERLGQAGKLRLARVAVADGKTLWDVGLPLTEIQSVRRLDKSILLFGIEYTEGDPEISDPLRDSPRRLVAIDLAGGTPQAFSLSALETHLEPTEVDLGR